MASDENFFDQLNTKVISDAPATDIQGQSNPVHLQKSNKEVLSSIKLVNDATLRSDGGPIPATGQIKQVTLTNTDRTVWFTPAKGEVWQLIVAGSTASSGPSGSLSYYFWVSCKDQNGTDQIVYSGSESSGSTEVQLVDFLDSKGDWLVDENMTVQCSVSSMQGVTSFNLKMLAIRIR